ncbi:MAG: hypothetical protein VX693_12630 [Pseudomonadota bacterium]|nr:hypothetical protein [Pseudomonadota bacterium]
MGARNAAGSILGLFMGSGSRSFLLHTCTSGHSTDKIIDKE